MASSALAVRSTTTQPMTLRQRCEKRLEGMKTIRCPYEGDWRQIARHARPDRTRFLNNDTNKNKRRPMIYDGHAIRAFRTLANGMTSGLSSSSRPWFKLATYDEQLSDDAEVRGWLTDVEKRMYTFLALTNFYGAAKTGYAELGLFGTEACVMVEHHQYGAVCHALTAGEYWIALNDAMMPSALYRRVPMTVLQAVQSFRDKVSQRVRNLYDAGTYEDTVEVFHAIEQNQDRAPGALDAANKPWRSIYWDEADRYDKTLRISGYDEQPFWAPRWDTTGSDAYGSSPGQESLPDMRELQMQAKRKGEATDNVIWPEIIVDPKIKLKRQPKAVTSVATIDQSQVVVPHQVPYQAIELIRQDIEQVRTAIDEASFAELFMAITNMQGVQPRNVEEIAARNEEKLTQLGPVIERVNNEKLEVAIERTYSIMERGGLLPPLPDELHGQQIKIEFISILTQMQRLVGIGQIERTAGFVGNLIGEFPEAGDKLNIDKVIDGYADRAGMPMDMIRTDKEVAAIRAQRAQQQQSQQMAESMPALKDGADAVKALAAAGQNAAPATGAPMPL